MGARKAYFSFSHLSDNTRHVAYNSWHQLDHRPENLAIDGVLYGERWVHTPRCAAARRAADPVLAPVQYVTAYWFAEPSERSIAQWQDLAEISFQWGRRPDRPWTLRPLQGFFSCIRTYVSPALSLSPQALPYRPKRGVYVVATRVPVPHSDEAQELFGWYDSTAIPAYVAREGISGACTFSSDSTTLDTGWQEPRETTTFDPGAGERGQIRVYLYFLDADPHSADFTPPLPGSAAEQVLFAGALETITPWQWDWFSGQQPASGQHS
jgi:hypothetical protein